MKLGAESKRLLKEAQLICKEALHALSKPSLTMKDLDDLSMRLRQAAARAEEVSGRLFYAGQRKSSGRKKV